MIALQLAVVLVLGFAMGNGEEVKRNIDLEGKFVVGDIFSISVSVSVSVFRCVHASLYEALSVRPWVRGSVGRSVTH